MNRREVFFPLRDAGLRNDVRLLGTLVGEVLEEQGGERLFHLVESVRVAAIQRREGEPGAGTALSKLVSALDVQTAGELVRAFSTYFQVVNLAERMHRIRRNRDYLLSGAGPQPGGLEDAMRKLVRSGLGIEAMKHLLSELCIEPVFTAHPTEATRRTILEKHFRIAQRLGERMNPSLVPREDRAIVERIRMEIATLWQTEEHPSARRTVADELEHVLFYITDILYDVLPAFYETLEEVVEQVYGNVEGDLAISPFIRFSSWVGGDMDGNPNVTAQTIQRTLSQHRALILKLYRQETEALYRQLSQSLSRISFNAEVMDRLSAYEKMLPDVFADIPARHRNMPYRALLRLMQGRLNATERDATGRYNAPKEFVEDLRCIAQSLKDNQGLHAGLFTVQRLLRRAETFGFHLTALDVRQDARTHREVVGRLLNESDWIEWPASKRATRLLEVLKNPVQPIQTDDEETRQTLSVFAAIDTCRQQFGSNAIGPYIASMTQDVDDVYSILLLARWGGLVRDDGQVPLDICPLFETVDDLNRAPDIMQKLLSCDIYKTHVQARNNHQLVMVGYSDSNKDGGIVAARWALQQTVGALVKIMAEQRVELTIFHGRGGTVSRGGGKLERAILSSPQGAVQGRLRVTEQGEIINAKYGLRGIAIQELEQMVGAVLQATARAEVPDDRDPVWAQVMHTMAEASRTAYRALVYDDPDFYHYFRHATPIDVIERMQIGSRPAARRSQTGIENLRAIPWVFAWTQSRQILPGWYGLGAGLSAAINAHGEALVADVVRTDPFLRSLLEDLEMVLVKTDMDIAAHYAALAGTQGARIFAAIREEYACAVKWVLKLKDNDQLLDEDPTLQRALRLRDPYVDPMSLLQVDLLRRWRASNCEDEEVFSALLATVNGIAVGLQNTG